MLTVTQRALRAMAQALAHGRGDVEAVLDEFAQAGYHTPADVDAVRQAIRELEPQR